MNGPLDYFQVEAGERIERLQSLLADCQHAAPGRAELDDLFRQAHSLKGAAGVSGASAVAELCHRMEDVLGQVRSGETLLDAELIELLVASTDRVGVLVQACALGGEPPPDDADCLTRLEARLAAPQAAVPGSLQGHEPQQEPRAQAPGEDDDSKNPPVESATTEPAEAPTTPAPAPVDPVGNDTVRVRVTSLDGLRERSSELIIAGARLNQRLADALEVRRRLRRSLSREPHRIGADTAELGIAIDHLVEGLAADSALLAPLIHDLHSQAMDACMLPIGHLFEPFRRFVREYCRSADCDAVLDVDGAGVRIDRRVMERLQGPLVHLLRNALAHGIEPPAARRALGKDPVGRIALRAFSRGEKVTIVCEDDGRGIDRQAVLERAEQAGLITAEDIGNLSNAEVHALLLEPGFSTAPEIGQVSGRGVGLDEVARAVQALSGHLLIESEPGRFTRFTIEFATAAATLQGVVVQASGHHYVLPASHVIQGIRIRSEALQSGAGGYCFIEVDGLSVPLLRLAALGAPGAAADSMPPFALVVSHGQGLTALGVDRIVAAQSVVTRRLPPQIGAPAMVIGATILGTGHPALVIEPELLTAAGRAERLADGSSAEPAPNPVTARLLVVDDSLTTRMMEQNILCAAGYAVETAVSAEDALAKTAHESFDLIVTDVEMPGLSGFDLTRRLRGDARFSETPIVVVSSLGTDEHRREGYDAGANAYIVKGQFDQNELLSTVAGLLQ